MGFGGALYYTNIPGLQVSTQQKIYFLPWGQVWQPGPDLQQIQSGLNKLKIMTPENQEQECQIAAGQADPPTLTARNRTDTSNGDQWESVGRGQSPGHTKGRVGSCFPEPSRTTVDSGLLRLLLCICSGHRRHSPTLPLLQQGDGPSSNLERTLDEFT